MKHEGNGVADTECDLEELREKLISAQKRENDSKVKVIAY